MVTTRTRNRTSKRRLDARQAFFEMSNEEDVAIQAEIANEP
jgi:hypothetical protein